MREAIVINTATKLPFLDMDPIELEQLPDGTVSTNNIGLLFMFEAMTKVEEESGMLNLALVWSDDMLPVVLSGLDDMI